MPYIINRASGEQFLTLEDGTLDTSTSIGLVGRNYTGYGEVQNENFLFLLENFANENPPARPISGQLWFDSVIGVINVYDGDSWNPVGSAGVSETSPVATTGALWLKESTNQLYVFNGNEWTLIGPEAVEGFGVTKVVALSIRATDNNSYPILAVTVNDTVIAIHASSNFTIDALDAIPGFSDIVVGTTISTASDATIKGHLTGNADTATRLETPRSINGVPFDGQTDITITSSTTGTLLKGNYITGSNYDGSTTITWAVDATSSNVIGKVVARDSAGDFSAGTITADLVGNVTGNVTSEGGISSFDIIEANEIRGATLSGNSYSASRLQTARKINDVLFDGSADVTVPADANTLTGSVLNPSVLESSLTSVGLLTSLKVLDAGIVIGNNDDIIFRVEGGTVPTLAVQNGLGLAITINDPQQAGGTASFEFVSSEVSLEAGGSEDPAFVGDLNSKCNIGLPTRTFGNVYSDNFIGIASSAKYADLAERYSADAVYEPGTVLEFGGEFEVTLASAETAKVAGVVSTNPAYLMNSELKSTNTADIALQGRVPCKVLGKVSKGDMLVSAGNGYAKVSKTPSIGTVIGKSLENFDGEVGVIEVVVGRI